MPDDAGRDAAFYDHENEPRRHVADWGGDELFTRMPRRRTIHTGPPPRFRRPAPIDPIHRPSSESAGRFRMESDDGGLDGRREPDADLPAHGNDQRGPSGRRRAQDLVADFGPDDRPRPVRGEGDGGPISTDGPAAVGRSGEGRADRTTARRSQQRTGRFARTDRDISERDSARDGLRTSAEAAWDYALPSSRSPFDDFAQRPADDAAPGGRRTVVIAGRPDGMPRPPRDRRRPPRTVAERVGPRPERIVAWAFALGLLLILIAIATADAATI